jgi:hypothetical protein
MTSAAATAFLLPVSKHTSASSPTIDAAPKNAIKLLLTEWGTRLHEAEIHLRAEKEKLTSFEQGLMQRESSILDAELQHARKVDTLRVSAERLSALETSQLGDAEELERRAQCVLSRQRAVEAREADLEENVRTLEAARTELIAREKSIALLLTAREQTQHMLLAEERLNALQLRLEQVQAELATANTQCASSTARCDSLQAKLLVAQSALQANLQAVAQAQGILELKSRVEAEAARASRVIQLAGIRGKDADTRHLVCNSREAQLNELEQRLSKRGIEAQHRAAAQDERETELLLREKGLDDKEAEVRKRSLRRVVNADRQQAQQTLAAECCHYS